MQGKQHGPGPSPPERGFQAASPSWDMPVSRARGICALEQGPGLLVPLKRKHAGDCPLQTGGFSTYPNVIFWGRPRKATALAACLP